MAKVYGYDDFLNEEFFRKLRPKKNKSDIDSCVREILNFLNSNEIYTWDDFTSSNKVDRLIIDKIIDKSTKNMAELKEVRFKIRLELSNREQLREYLKELEESEEFEKCAEIVKKLSQR